MTLAADAPSTVVLTCWAVLVVTWVVAALSTKRTLERRWGWEPLLFLLAGAAAWQLVRGPAAYHSMRLWRPTPAREWLAAAVVAAGLAVTVWARAALGRNWDGCVAFKQGHVLVVSGPYRYVRHPIYSGLFVMALGTAMLGAWSWGFALAALLLVSFWFKLRAEERLLTEHFPDAYPAYRRRVKALIPYVF